MYTGADPEGFVRGLYEADAKQEAALLGLHSEGIRRRIFANRIIETEFTMRGVDGERLPLNLRKSEEMGLSLSAKSLAIALRISYIHERGDDVFTAVLDRATKKWIRTAALSVKPD